MRGKALKPMSFFRKFFVPLLSKLGFYELRYLAYSKVVIRSAVLLRPKLGKFLCLDIGCSNGAFTRKLSGICDEAIGLDINFHSDWTMNDKAGADFIVADASRIPIRSRSVNLVVAFSLLEHVPMWGRVIEQISRVLDKGLVIIQIPNLRFIIEPHTYFPLLAYLPKRIRDVIVQVNCPGCGSLQFDCSPNNVINALNRDRLIPLGIYAHWHAGNVQLLSRNIVPPPSYFIIALKS